MRAMTYTMFTLICAQINISTHVIKLDEIIAWIDYDRKTCDLVVATDQLDVLVLQIRIEVYWFKCPDDPFAAAISYCHGNAGRGFNSDLNTYLIREYLYEQQMIVPDMGVCMCEIFICKKPS